MVNCVNVGHARGEAAYYSMSPRLKLFFCSNLYSIDIRFDILGTFR